MTGRRRARSGPRWHAARAATVVLPLLFLAVVLLVGSCGTTQRSVVAPASVAGASFVGDAICYDCHTNISRAFQLGPHARIRIEGAERLGKTGCESCHGAGSLHVQAGGGARYIINPGKEPATCFKCHLDVHAQFRLPRHHPVLEGHMNCVQCHDPHGLDILKPARGLAMARLNETCAECHREQSRPFVFVHEALQEGCTVCHQPHGSVNDKMLVQPDPNLCLRCHAQVADPSLGSGQIFIGKVDHTLNLQMGTCWSAGCHTAVHGSNVDPRLRY